MAGGADNGFAKPRAPGLQSLPMPSVGGYQNSGLSRFGQGFMPPAYVPRAYQNSGLGRFGQGFVPYRPPAYVPRVYQPQALPPMTMLFGGSSAPGAGPADLGVGSVGPSDSGYQVGADSNNGFQPGFGPDGMTAVTPASPISNAQAQIAGTVIGALTGLPFGGWAGRGLNSYINNQHTTTAASHAAQMDSNPGFNGTIGDYGGYVGPTTDASTISGDVEGSFQDSPVNADGSFNDDGGEGGSTGGTGGSGGGK